MTYTMCIIKSYILYALTTQANDFNFVPIAND